MRRVTLLATIALLAVARPVTAGIIITVGGTFQSEFNDGTGGWFDGQSYRDLPPLLDLNRLQGGSFTASFVIPDAAAAPRPGTGIATDNVPASAAITFTLFDASGAVVHRGVDPSDAFIQVWNDQPFGTARADRVAFNWFANTVTGATPPPERYGGGGLFADQSTIAWLQNAPPGDILTDLSAPIDPAVYRRFAGGTFSTGLVFLDGDTDNGVDPYQYVETYVSYSITNVSVGAVPEPSSVVLALSGTALIAAGSLWRRRTRGGPARERGLMGVASPEACSRSGASARS